MSDEDPQVEALCADVGANDLRGAARGKARELVRNAYCADNAISKDELLRRMRRHGLHARKVLNIRQP